MSRPEPTYSQEQLRSRRRAGLPMVYDGSFALADEVTAIVVPLARRVTGLPKPQACTSRVDALADAVHGELIFGAIGWLAELKAREHIERTSAHLDSANKIAATRLLVDMTPRPAAPRIGPEELASGQWATELVELAQTYTAALSDLLTRARPPGDPDLRGLDSHSERLCALLREADSAARQLEIAVDKAEATARRRPTPQTPADTARAELAKLGVPLP